MNLKPTQSSSVKNRFSAGTGILCAPGAQVFAREADGSQIRAFTLIEVLLAMAIAAGILMVVLFFYRQSETLRANLLDETSRASAARLVMERLSTELSSATRGGSATFSGAADRLQFVKLDFPQQNAWTNRPGTAAETPFCMVTYSLMQSTNPGETGLLRSEEFLSGKPAAVVSTNDDPVVKASGGQSARRSGSVISQIQYLKFRYWDGTNWVESWSASGLPAGVEVSLGNDPAPSDAVSEDYPYNFYRRVIYVPNHAVDTTNGVGGELTASGEVAP